jgi:hypothetical protein
MSKFNRASEALKKVEGRQVHAQALLSALRPELQLALNEKTRLEEEAAQWEEVYWQCAAGWFMEVWAGELRTLVPAQVFLAWYCAFVTAVHEELGAELEVFMRAVRMLTGAR